MCCGGAVVRCHLHTVEEHTNGWPAAVVLARTTLLLPTAKFYTAAAAVWTLSLIHISEPTRPY